MRPRKGFLFCSVNGKVGLDHNMGWGQASVIALLFKFAFKQSPLSKA